MNNQNSYLIYWVSKTTTANGCIGTTLLIPDTAKPIDIFNQLEEDLLGELNNQEVVTSDQITITNVCLLNSIRVG